jgi:hypothetical protein
MSVRDPVDKVGMYVKGTEMRLYHVQYSFFSSPPRFDTS